MGGRGRKNILSDSDFAKGWDNRYGSAVHIGFVSEVVCDENQANVRVIMPDKVDHEDTPLNTKPIPVLQVASMAKKQFAVPRVGTPVAIIKMPNGTSNYLVVGTFYSTSNPPPVTDPLLDYTEWEGGHIQKFDANEDAEVFLTEDFKGGWKATIKKDIDIQTTDSGKVSIVGDGDVLVKSATGNVNVESPTGTVTIKQQTIRLEATEIQLVGHVTVEGNMDQLAHVHQDSLGFHTGAAMKDQQELLARVAVLERRLHAMETVMAARTVTEAKP